MTASTDTEEGTRADLRWKTIPGLLRDVAQRRPDAEALVDLSGDDPKRLTFSQLLDEVNTAARAVVAAGVKPGDRVAIWAPNCWEWEVALLALQSAGAALVPLNTRYKGLEAVDILKRSGAKVLFTVEGFLGNDYLSMLREAAHGDDLGELREIVLLRNTSRPVGARTFAEFLDSASSVDPAVVDAMVEDLQPTDTSDLLFTSGTTGKPKGVIQSHASTLRAFGDWADIVGLADHDRYLVINPFFHAFGYKAGIVAALITGCTIVPLPAFDVDEAVDVIIGEQISMIPGPPTLYQTLLNHPHFDPAATPTLRLAVTGAAAVPVKLVEQMHKILGFENVITAYGLTEASGVVTVCRSDDSAETIAHTSGRAIPGVEVRIVDDSGSELPRGEAGEIVVRGYNVMSGYFEDPGQTAETIDSDGWLHTGDVGTMDADGYIDITDRKKDMFIVGGFNAYPAEIEALMSANPEIAQCAVVGIPDERMGEVGHAFVVPTAGLDPEPAELIAWARENMANFKAPRGITIVSELPLNASGKVMKFELRDRLTG